MNLSSLRKTLLTAGLFVFLPLASALAYPVTGYLKIDGIDGESVAESTDSIDRLYHELTHVVQQRSGTARHEAAHVTQSRKGKPGAEIAALADQIMAESQKLTKLYKTPEARTGKKHAQAIGTDARKIRQLANQLNSAKSADKQTEIFARISERLRHKDRAVDGHKDWINLMSVSQPVHKAGSQAADPDDDARMKVSFPTLRGTSGSAGQADSAIESGAGKQSKNIRKNISVISNKRDTSSGDPDRPVIIGRPANPESTDDEETGNKGGNAETTWKVEKGEQ